MKSHNTILVVDDNEAMRYSISRLLRTAGHEALEAASGEECLQLLNQHAVDLILLDVRLPGMPGTEVLRQIKSTPKFAPVFVVHLSALHREPSAMAAALRDGADGYLAHPIANDELLARVDAFLRHKKTLDALQQSEARYRALFENNPQAILVFDQDTGRILKANAAAAALYQQPAGALEGRNLQHIQEGPLPKCGVHSEERTHQLTTGAKVGVEISTHAVEWDGSPACVLVVTDLTARHELEQERKEQREQFDGEMRSLEGLSRNRQTPVTARHAGAMPLLETHPEVIAALAAEYEGLLDAALEARIFKVENKASPKLRGIADELVRFRAGPRDIVQVHYTALKNKTAETISPKARGYVEAGRMLLIELLGLVVAGYRLQGGRTPASAE
ncbi:MAG TPA: response regulator [Methylomirabilota bacterium]|nr:response regulator [Methylomirabilota bacterium]